MPTKLILAAGFAALMLTACDDAGDAAREPPVEPAEEAGAAAPEGSSGERAGAALERAGESARQTLEDLGEAGQAGWDALQENAPEVREGLNEAGERIRNAAGALMEETDPAPADAEGDSAADADETPEAREPAQ
jgi:hypothetical protein